MHRDAQLGQNILQLFWHMTAKLHFMSWKCCWNHFFQSLYYY